jgi:hypothetical protein
MPMTQGAQLLYDNVIRPFHVKHHGRMDNAINSAGQSLTKLIYLNTFGRL